MHVGGTVLHPPGCAGQTWDVPYLVAPVIAAGQISSRPQPELHGPKFRCRPFSRDHVGALVASFADTDIQQWHARRLDSDNEARGLIDDWNRCWQDETGARWAIVDVLDGHLLGQVGFRSIDVDEGDAEISYWLLPRARGQGVATESARLVTEWALNDVGLNRVELHHSVVNVASCQVARRAGFEFEGTMYRKALHADGWHDMHLHSRLRPPS